MGFESYIMKDGKKLKRGYTTGSTVAGAAKAAVRMFFSRERIEVVEIDTPAGINLNLELAEVEIASDYVRAGIIKDGGDDPDVTDGLLILARVTEIESGIKIEGGPGVGQVTRPGLAVSPGQAAINPVPRQMIAKEVKEVLPPDRGVRIVIEVPRGQEVAARTFNPRLGIKGGISILGTTGIVEPMSNRAYRESLALELKQAVALGEKEIVLIFGNYGKKMAARLGYAPDKVVKMSNFVGYMLKECVRLEIEGVILVGNLGKIVKVAAGIFNTYSHLADARLETIAAYTAACGGERKLINRILAANNSEETINFLAEAGLRQEVFSVLAERVAVRAREYVKDKLEVKTLIFSMKKEILGSYGLMVRGDKGE